MTTISCPRCETTFESQATTATRCRECRSVVHVGQRTTSGTARRAPSTRREEEPGDDEGDAPDTVALVLVAVAVGVGIYLFLRAWRRRRAAQEQGDGDAAASDVVNPREPPS